MRPPLHLISVNERTGQIDAHCDGPLRNGACPRVAMGDVVPCSKHLLVRVGDPSMEGYAVPAELTICPVVLAQSLAVPVETSLLP